MTSAGKLLLIAGVGRGVYRRWRFRRMASALTAVLMLAVAAAVMISALVMGGFYAAYLFFLGKGMEPSAALLVTGLFGVLAAAAVLVAIGRRLEELRSSVATPVGEAADAFLNGLLSR